MNNDLVSEVAAELAAWIEPGQASSETIARAIIPLVLEHERERCAKVAEHFANWAYDEGLSEDVVMARAYMANDIAAAIRAEVQP